MAREKNFIHVLQICDDNTIIVQLIKMNITNIRIKNSDGNMIQKLKNNPSKNNLPKFKNMLPKI